VRKAGTALETITGAIPRYISSKPDWQEYMGPAKWLRGARWEDTPGAVVVSQEMTRAERAEMIAENRKRLQSEGILP